MKKGLIILTCLVVLLGSLAFTGAASADVAYVCYYSGFFGGWPQGTTVRSELYAGNGTLLRVRTAVAVTDNANFFLPVMMPIDGYEIASLTFPGFGTFTFPPFSVIDFQLPIANCSGGGIRDGRVNNAGDQMAAPVAIYCSPVADGGIDAYDIDASTSEGTLAFRTSGDEVSSALANAAAGGGSEQIASGLGDSLWATAQGTLSVTGPDMSDASKSYRFDFAGDTCSNGPLAASASQGSGTSLSLSCADLPLALQPYCS